MINGQTVWNEEIVTDMLCKKVSPTREITTYNTPCQSLYDLLTDNLSIYADKTAIVDNDGSSYRYSQLKELADSFSEILYHQYSISSGQHVALLLYNSIEYCISLLALSKLGAIIIPLSTKNTPAELSAMITASNTEAILCASNFFDALHSSQPLLNIISADDILPACHSWSQTDDVPAVANQYSNTAFLLFTSGTTAGSKIVVIKNYNLIHAVISYQRILGVTAKDQTIIPIPLFYVTGLVALFSLFIYAKGTIYLHKYFDTQRILDDVKMQHITLLHASPTIFTKLLELSSDFPLLPSLRAFVCGSSNMPKQRLLQIHQWLPQLVFHTVYGLTETTSPATIFPSDAATSPHIGSSGLPIPGLLVKITDEQDRELPPLEIGEVQLSGSNLLDSYLDIDCDALQNGWLATGDLGYLTADGYLFIMDRKKDMINRGGEKIWCLEVENVLLQMEEIREAAVFGIPHDTYGEVPVAAIECHSDRHLSESKIIAFLSEKIAKYKIPTAFQFWEHIPLTRNSKINKTYLRNHFNPNFKGEET